ncbi:uncharacterized mitochondrial protein AtMg00240-like [Cicer arietinum]|uniref:uncharacterized mitochondrial protein AtMg00240-like n=1 Tax=Cicer arietinum TaxID=3827 RepID=UPI003CC604F2
MIGSLLYLTASRPDIVLALGLCARFQSSPKESHFTAVKRIFHYLVGTTDLGIWYSKGSHFDFVAYCDADYAGDKMERKSTSGAFANCCSQVLWIKNQLEDYSVWYSHIPIYCDNTSAINLSKNPI